jgi:hypothetical protein
MIQYIKYYNTSYQVSSFFYEVSAYITLFETLVVNILNVWILDSVASIRKHLLIFT